MKTHPLTLSLLLLVFACSEENTVGLNDAAPGTSGQDAAAAADASPTADASGVLDLGASGTDAAAAIDAGSVDSGADPVDSGVSQDATVVADAGTTNPFQGTLDNWCTGQPANFSFFVTSMNGLWTLSGDPINDLNGGFGGNFGGVAGADLICQTIAEATGFGHKTWRAFLSATNDGSGNAVHAIERIGNGPWYDANGLQVATGLAGLAGERPDGDARTIDDLPDECGVPLTQLGDAHDVVTGSNAQGRLNNTDPQWTCNDWTTVTGGSTGGNRPPRGMGVMCGHSFPRMGGGGRGGRNWVSDHPLRGCGKGANLLQNGAGVGTCIGCSGGYGALYCFAL